MIDPEFSIPNPLAELLPANQFDTLAPRPYSSAQQTQRQQDEEKGQVHLDTTIYRRLLAEMQVQQPTSAQDYFNYHQHRYEELFTALDFYLADRPAPSVAEVGVSGFMPLYKQLFPHLRLTTIDRPVDQYGVDSNYCIGVCGGERHYNFDLNEVELTPELGTPPLGAFDYVICTEVIEHLLVDPVEFVASLIKLLKPNGYLYLTTPNFLSYYRVETLLKGHNPMPVYPRRDQNQHRGHHYREYTMNEMLMYVREAGGHLVSAQFSDIWDKDHPHPELLAQYPELRSNLVLVAARSSFAGLNQGAIVTPRPMVTILHPFLTEHYRLRLHVVWERFRLRFR